MSEYQDKYRRIATTAIPSVFGSALHVRLNVIAGVITRHYSSVHQRLLRRGFQNIRNAR
ncbi:hypothetical protein R2226_003365 [Cronobacter sakazakii]|nr:hypothetical protein [Cronobacter sakazakii]